MSLEYLDDVAVHYADGTLLAEQTKSALKHNPLSDWAEDFWKSLSNWLASCKSGQLAASKTTFHYYVTPVHSGAIAQTFSDATTPKAIAAATNALKSSLAKLKKPPACMPYIQNFLDATDEERLDVVRHLKVTSVDADPVQPIRALIESAVIPELIDRICRYAIGEAKEQVDELIRKGQPPIISGDKFKAIFRAFVQKNNLPGFLVSFTAAPSPGEVASVLSNRPTFIRQLELIDLTEDQRVRAVGDFLRASADKSKWAELGLIFEGNLLEWDDDLVRRYGFIREECADTQADKPALQRGRIVYNRCAQLQAPLDGRVVPGHFVHGCFNSLADQRRVGWHPDFLKLLDDKER